MSGGVVGVVLAAGRSERMGEQTKQLLRFGDRTMVSTVVGHAESSQLDHVVVVTGRDADAVVASLGAERATIVHNPDFDGPNMVSLRRGVAAVDSPAAVLLLLGDMPGVDTPIIDAFVDRWRRDRPWGAYAVYADGIPNHPFLLSAEALAVMPDGPKVLWHMLVEAPPQEVAQVPFDREAPIDVDTPEAYVAALRRLGLREPD